MLYSFFYKIEYISINTFNCFICIFVCLFILIKVKIMEYDLNTEKLLIEANELQNELIGTPRNEQKEKKKIYYNKSLQVLEKIHNKLMINRGYQ